MALDPLTITSLLSMGKIALERLIPDKAERAKQILKLEEMARDERSQELESEVKLLLAQIEVNKIEASHKSLFVSGWRPGAGWVSVVGLALAFWPKAIALTIIWSWQCISIINGAPDLSMVIIPTFPDLGVTDLIGLLGSMLGIGAMRPYCLIQRVNKIRVRVCRGYDIQGFMCRIYPDRKTANIKRICVPR